LFSFQKSKQFILSYSAFSLFHQINSTQDYATVTWVIYASSKCTLMDAATQYNNRHHLKQTWTYK